MSRVKGAGRVRRMLKRLPDEIRNEMARALQQAGPKVLARTLSETPRKTGNLRSLLTQRFYARTLRLRVGLLTKAANRKAFYAHILEVGRKSQVVNVKRRTQNGVIAYRMQVRQIERSRFDMVRGRTMQFARQLLRPVLSQIYERALRKAASGGGDD